VIWVGSAVLAAVILLAVVFVWLLYLHVLRRYLEVVLRVFQERPLFIMASGQPVEPSEEVAFRTADGLNLRGCYLRGRSWRRMGVILFGLEFGSTRWACVPYCDFLLDNGFDVFAFEPRGQGDSDPQPGYEPMQWVTHFEVQDMQAALEYLKGRADSAGRIGFFGISKGACAGLMAASREPFVRCFVTDGVFATRTTMIPYMQKWVKIFSDRFWMQRLLPRWFFGMIADGTLRVLRRRTGWRFPHLESSLRRLAPRPLLMIHGGADTYIKPEMAHELFELAQTRKELWVVDGAKHNQALAIAGDEYRRRVLNFFLEHLVSEEAPAPREQEAAVSNNGDATEAPVSGPNGNSREPIAGGR